MAGERTSWIRRVALVCAVGLGAYLRLRGLASLPLFGDEYHTVLAADAAYGTILGTFDTVGSHVPLPLLQRLALDVFGPGLIPFRLVAIVPGLLTLFLAYPLLRGFVGRDAAALATWLLAVSPMHVYYSRFARGYALALLLALVFAWAWLALLEGRRGRWTWALLIASGVLLPWVHLSTLGFVAAVGGAGVVLALREARPLALRLGGALTLAGALAFLLYLPVIGQVRSYFGGMKAEDPPLTWLGVPTLIAGGRVEVVLWLAALPIGAALLWRERRPALVLTLAALLGPLALLLLSRPAGMDYAWARYLLSALPFLAGLVACAFLRPARRWGELGSALFLSAGALLCLAQWRTGPLCDADEPGSLSNTYLALHRLEAFDPPFERAPAFYRELARDPAARRIVEAPSILTRALLLYRNYARLHGKEMVVGWTGELPRALVGPAYARLLEVGPEQADYLVLHKDQTREVVDYFAYVYDEVWPKVRRASDDGFMRRQESIYGLNLAGPEQTSPIAARLRERRGEPFYEDERILVWKLTP